MAKLRASHPLRELSLPKAPSDKEMVRDHAKRSKRHATESWISGHMTTKEHDAIHKRADHVLKGKKIPDFKGKVGERKIVIKDND